VSMPSFQVAMRGYVRGRVSGATLLKMEAGVWEPGRDHAWQNATTG
jgi:hypothetical protein